MKVVVLEPLGVEKSKFMEIAGKYLDEEVELSCFDDRVTDTETLIERSKDANIVVLSNFHYGKEVMEKCPYLKLVCVAFTGVDHVDVDYCKERGIIVCNCAGYSTAAVADLVFGGLITLMRNIIPCNETVRNSGTKDGLVGNELEGKKFGVVGTGAIGARVAKIAAAFGCEVYAFSRTQKPDLPVKYVDLDTLLSKCDIVSLHVPLSAATKHLINDKNIGRMKKNAILINMARGPVVDYKALAEALKKHAIAGAVVDVFEEEPPVSADHVLFSLENCICTPHVAFATKEAFVKRAHIVFDNIDHFLKGMPQNVI
ncbi:MAG: hydroxyacid dehydrogenase [Lachnospiraceae bacterium]|nr:hydroxyacid dehydrogenase [Lachnospiraceae bacterium]